MTRPSLHPLHSARRLSAPALALAAALLAAGCSFAPPGPPMPTVAAVDVDRYIGTWYEAASIPNWFQAKCASDTRARYRRQDDRLEVFNSCRRADGSLDSATGVAEVVPDSGNAKLRVSFFRPFYGDYWVLALDADYRWALVGEPGRRYGWVLSRAPNMATADLETALARAQALGYERQAFKATPQSPSPAP